MPSPRSRPHAPGRYGASTEYMERARRVLVRGVGSALRAAQRPTPLAIARAAGSRIVDVDGNRYVDYVLGFGPLLLGHHRPEVIDAVGEQLGRGVLFGAQHEAEAELGERIVRLVPGAELVALSTTGSEAVHAAIRLARAATGRRLIVKFEGHYHGWLDPLHVNGPTDDPAPGLPSPTHSVPGLPAPGDVLVCRWNDLEALAALLARRGDDVAAVIMEPVPCNFGSFEPLPGYLEGARRLCDEHGAVLIFDEVITGFRVALGGAQERYGVTPDLTVLAKAIASGFPLSAVAGRADVMRVATDEGPMRHIGTYNGNAVSVAAANATLELLERGGGELYASLEDTARKLAEGLRSIAAAAGAPLVVNQVGTVLQLLWSPRTPVRTFADAAAAERGAVESIASELLAEGVMAIGRGLWFVSTAHTDEDVEETLDGAGRAIASVAASRSTAGAVRAAR